MKENTIQTNYDNVDLLFNAQLAQQHYCYIYRYNKVKDKNNKLCRLKDVTDMCLLTHALIGTCKIWKNVDFV